MVRLSSPSQGPLRPALQAEILPEQGANVISLKAGDLELFSRVGEGPQGPGFMAGLPILYPMPNRVRNGVLRFENKTLSFPPNEKGHFLHGLVHSAPFDHGALINNGDGQRLELSVDFRPGKPWYSGFPYFHRLSLALTLAGGDLAFDYEVENRGLENLPYGLGLHPWFLIHGAPSQVSLQVPAPELMDSPGLLPSGKLLPLEGSPKDLRRARRLSGLDLDDVYMGLRPEEPMGFVLEKEGISLTLRATEEFGHAVVYTPEGAPHFCMENQTCSTDAHNLYTQGLRDVSGLIVLPPGAKKSGRVVFEVRKVP